MSNSSLVVFTKISPFRNSPRNHVIDTISIHCMAGNLSIEGAGDLFQDSESSAQYGIGSDGRIGQYVDEKDRAWCTSSGANDNRAITIEVANNGGAPDWPVSDAAYESLIKLLVDICRRNNIKQLLWRGDKALIGQVDKQNMTVHRWFANKACPGNYLYNRHHDIAARVNAILNEEDDDMAKVIEQIAAAAGMSVEETIQGLGVLAKFANKTTEPWEQQGEDALMSLELTSTPRDPREMVEFGEFGTILKRFKEKYIK